MNMFGANFQNELFKLKKRKKYWVFLIIGAALCVASGLKVLVANLITGGVVPREAILGGLTTANLPFILLIFLPLMAVMASCDLMVGESAEGTIRFGLMRPVGRGKLFFSKVTAVLALCAFDLGVLYVVTALTQMILGGTTAGLAVGVAAYVLDLIPLAVLILFFCLINQLLKGSTLAVLLCVVCYIGLMVLGTYLPSAGGLLFTGYLRWHNLWIGTMLPFTAMISRIGILAGYGMVFASCGYFFFDRKEV